ncbi:2OG-Fe dioxygenase family protein [Azohydromonas sp. G-1-1-14]|uniref:2OG-Fe dioxygenase family protein n=2 Tax=Azohydromonas caseinilytica TaxID=2728836 RepID=A0A848F8X4_9BURK|nr:2OG-Fe dioxygenase family protein [Azohydromonas caseinilytica]
MRLVEELQRQRYALMRGPETAAWLDFPMREWPRFGDYWNRLTLDRHMGDGGTYRFRRYGELELQYPDQLRQLPHGPYEQPRYINKLNGGIQRWFDPLEPEFVQEESLTKLLMSLARVLDRVEGARQCWNVRLHPYRIRASSDTAGQPTPEGLHRDGVDYIVVMMVRRHNVRGGESTITDAEGQPLFVCKLVEPLDFMVLDDNRTMHGVTPVLPAPDALEAYRDVLVLAFTKNAG